MNGPSSTFVPVARPCTPLLLPAPAAFKGTPPSHRVNIRRCALQSNQPPPRGRGASRCRASTPGRALRAAGRPLESKLPPPWPTEPLSPLPRITEGMQGGNACIWDTLGGEGIYTARLAIGGVCAPGPVGPSREGLASLVLGCGLPFRAGMKRARREPGRHTPLCVTNQIKSLDPKPLRRVFSAT